MVLQSTPTASRSAQSAGSDGAYASEPAVVAQLEHEMERLRQERDLLLTRVQVAQHESVAKVCSHHQCLPSI